MSATYKLPNWSIASPAGEENLAGLSVPPATPNVPANTDTTPAAVIFLMVWLPVSATYKLPSESKAVPLGELNVAAVPSMPPDTMEVPASRDTYPPLVSVDIILVLGSVDHSCRSFTSYSYLLTAPVGAVKLTVSSLSPAVSDVNIGAPMLGIGVADAALLAAPYK